MEVARVAAPALLRPESTRPRPVAGPVVVPGGRSTGARAPVERVVQGELLHREGSPVAFLHALRVAGRVQPQYVGSGTLGVDGPARGIAVYQAHQRMFSGAGAPSNVDEYA